MTYRRLEATRGQRFLVLSSDGFTDLCTGEGQTRILRSWAQASYEQPPEREYRDNMALKLLHRALGGDDRDRYSVSRVLTLDMEFAWIDDTSIVVQTI